MNPIALFCVLPIFAAAGSQAAPDPAAVARGHAVAQSRCSECHAVEASGASHDPSAPPFRSLGAYYPLENLESALEKGTFAGHAEMPRYTLEELEVDDLVAYLKSLRVGVDRTAPRHHP